jgi:hypothetical protein
MKKAFLGIAAVSILVILVLLVVKVTGSTGEAEEITEVKTECCTKAAEPTASCCDSDSKADATATADCAKTDCDKSKTECTKTETASAVTETAAKKDCSATCTGH